MLILTAIIWAVRHHSRSNNFCFRFNNVSIRNIITARKRKMKIIHKYIAKEVLLVSAIGFFILTFFLIMNSLFVMSDLLIKYGVDLLNVTKLLLLLLPSTVAVTVPMAVLMGVLLTYSRLVQDNEFNGMQANGISVSTIAKPGIILSLVITMVMVLFNNYVLSYANLTYQKVYYEIVKKRSSIMIQEHTFINDFDNYIFYIGSKDSKNDLLKDIIVFVKGQNDEKDPTKIIFAKTGQFISDEKSLRVALKLMDGTIQVSSYATPLKMNEIAFGTNYVDLDIKGVLQARQNEQDFKGAREMTAEELLAELKKGKDSKHDRNNLLVELHKKLSIPFATFIFAIIGIPIGLVARKGGRITGISISLVLIFIYYILLSIGQSYGYSGKMNHFLAVWLPNIVIGALGLVFYVPVIFPAIRRKNLNKPGKTA